VSFDGNDVTISGDTCLSPPVPAIDSWGLIVLTLAIASLGASRLRSRT
jgi:hypothetical protein